MTTRELSLPLSTNQNVDWSKEFRFRIRITSGEQEIYDSGTALYRQYIVLNQVGEEIRSPKLGAYTVHLLVPDNGRVVINVMKMLWISLITKASSLSFHWQ